MAASLAWGGHQNGYIPADAMVPIGGGYPLEKGAAAQFLAAAAELKREHGIDLIGYISETYRDWAGQVYQKKRWTELGKPWNAADPGYSIHGWAKAVDFNEDALRADGIYHLVMAVLEKFGFVRDVSGEGWHVSYRENLVIVWASDVQELIEEEEDMAECVVAGWQDTKEVAIFGANFIEAPSEPSRQGRPGRRVFSTSDEYDRMKSIFNTINEHGGNAPRLPELGDVVMLDWVGWEQINAFYQVPIGPDGKPLV